MSMCTLSSERVILVTLIHLAYLKMVDTNDYLISMNASIDKDILVHKHQHLEYCIVGLWPCAR
jgi:hypothetical protein